MPRIRPSRLVRRALTPGSGLEGLSREQLLERAYAVGLPGIAAGWKTATIIRKIEEIENGT